MDGRWLVEQSSDPHGSGGQILPMPSLQNSWWGIPCDIPRERKDSDIMSGIKQDLNRHKAMM